MNVCVFVGGEERGKKGYRRRWCQREETEK